MRNIFLYNFNYIFLYGFIDDMVFGNVNVFLNIKNMFDFVGK